MDKFLVNYDVEGFKTRMIEVLKMEEVRFWVDNLDVSRSVVSHKWLKGTTLPKAEILWNILKIKDISANWLFFGIEPKQLSGLSDDLVMSGDRRAAERFLKLFPAEVQDYIIQTVRLLPEVNDDHSLPLLVNTMNVLIAYLQREKEQLTVPDSQRGFSEAEADYEMRIGEKGDLLYCNPKMLEDFDLHSGRAYGKTYMLPVDQKDAVRFKEEINMLSPESPSVEVRIRMEMPTGVSEWHEWVFEARFDNSGKQKEMVARGSVVPPDRLRRR